MGFESIQIIILILKWKLCFQKIIIILKSYSMNYFRFVVRGNKMKIGVSKKCQIPYHFFCFQEVLNLGLFFFYVLSSTLVL